MEIQSKQDVINSELLNKLEKETTEPSVEVIGKVTVLSRGKSGGRDARPRAYHQ